MPGLPCAMTAVQSGVSRFLSCREGGCFARVEAYCNDRELFSDIERKRFEAVQQAVELLGAEHGTLVVNEREDHRLLAKVTLQRHRGSGFISKGYIER